MTRRGWLLFTPDPPRRPTCQLSRHGIVWINEDATVHELRIALSLALRLVHRHRRDGTSA